jgi:galactokinase/mevalonate kinase-like predicted kinase
LSRTGRGAAFARVALAGNPSDGYGGRTLAVAVPDFVATATAAPSDDDSFGSPGPGGEELMRATLARFRARVGPPHPVALSCETKVPREVGLAGSSAIVIACARALCDLCGRTLEHDDLAREALAVELEDLGIAAGLQDRVVQARETLVAMDFSDHPSYEELDAGLLPPLFVAWHPDAASPSGLTHSALRERYEAGEPEVTGAMTRLADLALRARDALLSHDHAAFAACMDGSFDERLRIIRVDPLTIAMVESARAAGAAANSAGSGGAIVGTVPHEHAWPEIHKRLDALGASSLRPLTPARRR